MPEENVLNYEFLLQIMNRLDFFNKFSLAQKQTLARYSSNFSVYNPGETLINEGDSDATLFILLSGRVMVTKGSNKKAITLMDAGDFFGEMSFITNSPRTATVTAQEVTIVIKVSQISLSELDIEIREILKDKIINKLVNRLDEMNKMFANNLF